MKFAMTRDVRRVQRDRQTRERPIERGLGRAERQAPLEHTQVQLNSLCFDFLHQSIDRYYLSIHTSNRLLPSPLKLAVVQRLALVLHLGVEHVRVLVQVRKHLHHVQPFRVEGLGGAVEESVEKRVERLVCACVSERVLRGDKDGG